MKKKENVQYFYFVDTREDAKSEEAFGISNPDTAKSWTKDYNNGEGPFKPVKEPVSDKGAGVVTADAEFHPEFQVNRRDLQQAGVNETPVQVEATAHNMNLVKEDSKSVYDGMDKKELQDELDAREIEYKKSGPESTNDFYIEQLIKDDKK